ncbi:MAG TPA: FAD-dependent oxidoreductase [Syntrophomonadaceae bacterium]|nr:FAD-dependent oxidoreductase [Syntrophomonadaceae bacterium]
MATLKIKDDVYFVGVQDPDLRIFDIIMETKFGTSYNAYLIKGSEKTVLIETVKEDFFDEYIKNIEEVVNLTDIDYLIMNHTEPDHAGSVEKLLERIPGLTVLGSATAMTFLEAIVNTSFSHKAVEDQEILSLGNKTLKFISAPFLHWPDSQYTYLIEDKVLFTIDSFGTHYSDERMFNDLIEEDFTESLKYYFDMIMGPFKKYILEALDKIEKLDYEIICPGHGPILRSNLPYYIDLYKGWAQAGMPKEKDVQEVVIAYVSAHGYTEILAESIKEGLETAGTFDIKVFDLVYADLDEVVAAIDEADGVLIGSPTINGDALPPIWQLLIRLSPIVHAGKVALAFGSYGWSGEAVPAIEHRLNALRMETLPGFRVNFKPSDRELEDSFTLGMDMGKKILEKAQDASQTKWRCVVCGYIHEGEEPPNICPACGVGKESFEKLDLEDEHLNDSNNEYVIIGGGIAALSAAENIRQRDTTGIIKMITEEAYRPYYRTMLSELLSKEFSDAKLYVRSDSWYKENNIDLITNCKITNIDTKAKKLVAEDSKEFSYDKLIIATGARSNIPPIPGADKQAVYSLRDLADALEIKARFKDIKKALVIGGGVLGLEAVWGMVKQGIEVTVVEFSDRIMPRQLDATFSQKLQDLMAAKGVKLHLGVATDEIIGDSSATGVKLSDGTIIETDLVLLSTGIKPNVELADEAGLVIKQGIIVDEKMRTNISDVFAIGDVAQFGERVIGLWPVSMEMGKIVASTVTGDWLEYKQPVLSTLLKAFDTDIFSVGEVNWPDGESRIVEVSDPKNNYYKRTFIVDGVLKGEIIMGTDVDTRKTLHGLGRTESGEKKYDKWICRVCNYVHEGSEPPDICPVCGAGKDAFDPVE